MRMVNNPVSAILAAAGFVAHFHASLLDSLTTSLIKFFGATSSIGVWIKANSASFPQYLVLFAVATGAVPARFRPFAWLLTSLYLYTFALKWDQLIVVCFILATFFCVRGMYRVGCLAIAYFCLNLPAT